MSFDPTYQWLTPIESEGQRIPWYSSVGLADGRVAIFSEDSGADRHLRFEIHKPALFLLPVYASGGPEGGGAGIAVWFLVAIVAGLCYLLPHLWRGSHVA
jgi:hypothetical protein